MLDKWEKGFGKSQLQNISVHPVYTVYSKPNLIVMSCDILNRLGTGSS